jgi:hypothetical protein
MISFSFTCLLLCILDWKVFVLGIYLAGTDRYMYVNLKFSFMYPLPSIIEKILVKRFKHPTGIVDMTLEHKTTRSEN